MKVLDVTAAVRSQNRIRRLLLAAPVTLWFGPVAAQVIVDINVTLPVQHLGGRKCPVISAASPTAATAASLNDGQGNSNPNNIHTGIPGGGEVGPTLVFRDYSKIQILDSLKNHPDFVVTTRYDYQEARNILGLSATLFYKSYQANPKNPLTDYCWANQTIEVDLPASAGFVLGIGSAKPTPHYIPAPSVNCIQPKPTDPKTCTIDIPQPPNWLLFPVPPPDHQLPVVYAQAKLYTEADEILALSERIFQCNEPTGC